MKDFAVGALAWIFLIYYFFYVLAGAGYSSNKEKYDCLLGKELVLCGDTVMITNYTWSQGIFHLSTGAQIEGNLAMEIYNSQNN